MGIISTLVVDKDQNFSLVVVCRTAFVAMISNGIACLVVELMSGVLSRASGIVGQALSNGPVNPTAHRILKRTVTSALGLIRT